ncbi:hypothetical protein PsYK624_148150 [Phanerochaete sordida]|uniref:Uncharacterized protein n=1 Tax=Phanerochaete sordida TaxID=48140 RepID=A0A9P3GN88_9APHY|nr:hypothetical protein PsYK624_148150 [Phanerochaete sordida]
MWLGRARSRDGWSVHLTTCSVPRFTRASPKFILVVYAFYMNVRISTNNVLTLAKCTNCGQPNLLSMPDRVCVLLPATTHPRSHLARMPLLP